MEKRHIYIDASSLKSDFGCDRRYLNHIVRGWTKGLREANYKAGYGTSFHVFLENYYSESPSLRAVNAWTYTQKALDMYKRYEPHINLTDVKEFRTMEHLKKLCEYYPQRYAYGDSITPIPQNKEGSEHLLESKFCVPFAEGEDYIIFLSGTIDMVADYGGRLVIVDHKTTGSWDVDRFFAEFAMNIQTQFYVRMFRLLSGMNEYLPIVVNGIFIKKPTKEAQKKGEWDGARLQRSMIIEYTDEQMAQFEWWLKGALSKIKALVENYKGEILNNDEPYELGTPNYSACFGRFSACPFYEMCAAPASNQIALLKSAYQNEQYSPLHFND